MLWIYMYITVKYSQISEITDYLNLIKIGQILIDGTNNEMKLTIMV